MPLFSCFVRFLLHDADVQGTFPPCFNLIVMIFYNTALNKKQGDLFLNPFVTTSRGRPSRAFPVVPPHRVLNTHLLPIYSSHLVPCLPDNNRALNSMAFSPRRGYASYALRVPRTWDLLTAAFRPRLASTDLAVRLTVISSGSVEDLQLQVSALCRAHYKKKAGFPPPQSLLGGNRRHKITRCSKRSRLAAKLQ